MPASFVAGEAKSAFSTTDDWHSRHVNAMRHLVGLRQGLDRSLFADPKLTSDAEIDLINQRQMLMPFGVLDFIDADGVDVAERPVLETPGDNMFDRVENVVPGGAKGLRRLFP